MYSLDLEKNSHNLSMSCAAIEPLSIIIKFLMLIFKYKCINNNNSENASYNSSFNFAFTYLNF